MKIKFYWYQDRFSSSLQCSSEDIVAVLNHLRSLNTPKWRFAMPSVSILTYKTEVKIRTYDIHSKWFQKDSTLVGAKGYAKKFLKGQFKKLGIEVDID
jgi:hypothetical protein